MLIFLSNGRGVKANSTIDSVSYYYDYSIQDEEGLKKMFNFIEKNQDLDSKDILFLLEKIKKHSIILNYPNYFTQAISWLVRKKGKQTGYKLVGLKQIYDYLFLFEDKITLNDRIYLYSELSEVLRYNYNSYAEDSIALEFQKKAFELLKETETDSSRLGKHFGLLISRYIPINYDSTLYYLEIYKHLFPKDLDRYYTYRAQLERAYGNYKEELSYIKKSMESNKRGLSTKQHELLVAYRNTGLFNKADSIGQILLSKNGLSATSRGILYINLGKGYLMQNQFQKAEAYFMNAKEEMAWSELHLEEIYDNLRQIYHQTNENEKLIKILDEQLHLFKKNRDIVLYNILQTSAEQEIYRQLNSSLEIEKQKTINAQRTVYILFISFLLVCVVFYMIEERQKRKRIQLKNELFTLQQKGLSNQFKSHFIFNLLSNVQYLINEKKYLVANQNLIKLGRLLRKVLMSIRIGQVNLFDEIHLIKEYIDLESVRFEDNFKYEIDKSCFSLSLKEVIIPTGIIQPIVENVILHAGGAAFKKICLRIYVEDYGDLVHLVIEDNGKGTNINSVEHLKSVGINLVKEQLALWSRVTEKAFLLQYKSRFTTPSFQGTQVVFTLPKLHARVKRKEQHYPEIGALS